MLMQIEENKLRKIVKMALGYCAFQGTELDNIESLRIIKEGRHVPEHIVDNLFKVLTTHKPTEVLKEPVKVENLTIVSDNETLEPLLPFGSEFKVAVDCNGDIVLFEGKLLTEEKFSEYTGDIPTTVEMVDNDELFITVYPDTKDMETFWDYLSVVLSDS